jgi:hypothetical protein
MPPNFLRVKTSTSFAPSVFSSFGLLGFSKTTGEKDGRVAETPRRNYLH